MLRKIYAAAREAAELIKDLGEGFYFMMNPYKYRELPRTAYFGTEESQGNERTQREGRNPPEGSFEELITNFGDLFSS